MDALVLDDLEAATRAALEARLGAAVVRRRLALEHAHETRRRARAARMFPLENWHKTPALIRAGLRLSGLAGRTRRNARALAVRHNPVTLPRLPRAFDGYTIMQLSDLHIDLEPDFVDHLIAHVHALACDLCVLTGDYRARTFGRFDHTLAALARLRPAIAAPCVAVLGNHDSLRMVPAMEAMGYRVLLNEAVAIARGGAPGGAHGGAYGGAYGGSYGGPALQLAGVDDAHHYRTDDVARAAEGLPRGDPAILLSHTPELYREAAGAGFDLFLCGHTHGGQLCLPGGVPVLIEARCPRRLARGAWRHGAMQGYTSPGAGASIVPARLNCPPEITLHRLRAA
jgi:predicted MPP superfamily phosphohydrolase